MRMQRIRTTMVAAALAGGLLTGASATLAQMGPDGGEYDRGGMMGQSMGQSMGSDGWGMTQGMGMGSGMMCPGMEGLTRAAMAGDLTDEQREQIRSMRQEMRREHMETMLQMMNIRDEMMTAMMAEQPSAQRVRELHDRMAEHRGEMLESCIETRNRMYDMLDEEQRQQMRDMRGQMGPGMMGPGMGN